MAEDRIRYDLRAQDALRNVIREVLAEVAETGLPGEHHFFITFRTQADGVVMSPRLKEQHPEEMTVVLQHQFWDFKVTDKAFEVSLSFNNIPEQLRIPFAAIKSFFDPSVHFGLQFEPQESEPPAPVAEIAAPADKTPPAEKDGKAAATAGAARPAHKAAASGPAAKDDGQDGEARKDAAGADAEIISLDSFRKKS